MSNFETAYREATVSDIPQMALVWDRATEHGRGRPVPDTLTEPNRVPRLETVFAQEGAWSNVGIVNDKVAAFVIGHTTTDENGQPRHDGSDYLAYLMRDPEYIGGGLGSTLLHWAVERSQTAGSSQLELWTTVDNIHARRLYEKVGFVAVGQPVMRHKKLGVPSIHYIKNLV